MGACGDFRPVLKAINLAGNRSMRMEGSNAYATHKYPIYKVMDFTEERQILDGDGPGDRKIDASDREEFRDVPELFSIRGGGGEPLLPDLFD